MRKMLGISLVAVLTAVPMMAHAGDVTAEQLSKAAIVNGDASTLATSAFVKGAYAELAGVINTKADKTDLTTAQTAIDKLNAGASVEGSVAQKIASAIEGLQLGTNYDAAGTAASLIGELDSSATQADTERADGLSLSVTEENGKITSISGAIKAGTYDTYGAATAAQAAAESYTNTQLANYTNTTSMNTAIATAKSEAIATAEEDATAKANAAKAYADGLVENLNIGDYATKTGVVATIASSTIPAVTAWGSSTVTNIAVNPSQYTTTLPAGADEDNVDGDGPDLGD